MDVALAPSGFVVAPTKLHVPDGGALVPRDGVLSQRLAAAERLGLVVAPRAAVAAWADGAAGRPVAWLSLDPEDADPVRLWRGIIAALRIVAGPAFGAEAEAILAAGPGALDTTVVPLVAAEAAASDDPPALVLDGVDALGDRAVLIAPSLARWQTRASDRTPLVVAARAPTALAPLATSPGSDPTTGAAAASAGTV